jgi:nitronate monooxygenase
MTTTSEALTALLGVRYPIMQAPMAGISPPGLAAAVSNAGGVGSLGLGASNDRQVRDQIAATRALTTQPFNVNFFCHAEARADTQREAAWLRHLRTEFTPFGVTPPAALRNIYATAVGNDALLKTLLETRPKIVSFHFGLPDAHWITALRQAGIVTMACATNWVEAAHIEAAGLDAVVAQGFEAGGHRGIFDPTHDDQIGTFALVRMLVHRSRLPVIAAGGIMDGRGIAAALQLGAAGVQMGTAFILCPESSATPAYRAELSSERAAHTAITSAISGRPARGIANRFYALQGEGAPAVPDYPIAYDAGKALHQAAASQGSAAYAAHWAGQAASLARALPAATLIQTLVQEWHDAVGCD